MGDWYVIKVRLHPGRGRRAYDLRTVRAIGTYPTFDAACDGAARACKAARHEEDAARFRYLVRHRDRAPRKALVGKLDRRRKADRAAADAYAA